MTKPEDYNDEGVIRLGVKCMEDMTREYISRHSKTDLVSFQNFLRNFLTNDSWLKSIVDPEEIIDCMERVRQERLRTDKEYADQWIDF